MNLYVTAPCKNAYCIDVKVKPRRSRRHQESKIRFDRINIALIRLHGAIVFSFLPRLCSYTLRGFVRFNQIINRRRTAKSRINELFSAIILNSSLEIRTTFRLDYFPSYFSHQQSFFMSYVIQCVIINKFRSRVDF